MNAVCAVLDVCVVMVGGAGADTRQARRSLKFFFAQKFWLSSWYTIIHIIKTIYTYISCISIKLCCI